MEGLDPMCMIPLSAWARPSPAGVPRRPSSGSVSGLVRHPEQNPALLGRELSEVWRQRDRNVMRVLSMAAVPDSSVLGVFHSSRNTGERLPGNGVKPWTPRICRLEMRGPASDRRTAPARTGIHWRATTSRRMPQQGVCHIWPGTAGEVLATVLGRATRGRRRLAGSLTASARRPRTARRRAGSLPVCCMPRIAGQGVENIVCFC